MSRQQIKPNEQMSSFGILLTSYMSKHELSVARIARETGLSEYTVFKWIKGKHAPSIPNLIMLSECIARYENSWTITIVVKFLYTFDEMLFALRREHKRSGDRSCV